MKIILNLFFIKLIFSVGFIPIPKENGILDSPYSHTSTDNLFFILEHFRHGARSPCTGEFINNTDELGGKWQNYGALTKIGIKQHFLLGKENRKRYTNFISKYYNPKEIKIYCSNYNRTMMSAQSQLLGFYNIYNFDEIKRNDDIIGEEKIENNISLNSIIPPINLFKNIYNKKGDNFQIIFSEKFKCNYQKEMIEKNIKEIDQLKSFDKINNIKDNFNKNYLKYFSKEFNMTDYTSEYKGMYKFCDMFICYYFDDGYNKQRLNKIEKNNKELNTTELLNLCYDFFHEKFFKVEGEEYAKESSNIIMSRMMKKIAYFMQSRIDKKNQKYIGYDAPKFVLYSGHDDTLTQMQLFLNKYFNINTEWVPFASTQIFELRKYGNIFYVELYYNNKLKMNITFKQFSDNIFKYAMSDEEIDEKCYGFRHSEYFLRVFILFLILILILIGYITTKVYFFLKQGKADIPCNIVLIN